MAKPTGAGDGLPAPKFSTHEATRRIERIMLKNALGDSTSEIDAKTSWMAGQWEKHQVEMAMAEAKRRKGIA